MLIGELAARAGVRPSTVRYYERAGVLREPPRTPTGYRDYGEEELTRLRFVRTAQSLGLRLDEVSEILSIRESGDRPCPRVLGILEGRARELSERIAALERLREELDRAIRRSRAAVSSHGDICPVIERAGAARDGRAGPRRPRLPALG